VPDVIIRTFSASPVMLQWYVWGVIVSLLLSSAVAIWVFNDRRPGFEGIILKTLAVLATGMATPAVLSRLHAGLATEMRSSLLLLAYLSIGACVAAIAVAVAQLVTRPHSTTSDRPFGDFSGSGDGLGHGPLPAHVSAVPEDNTVVLKSVEPAKPLAFLAITSGPYANTMLPLHAGMTRLGRDGSLCEHPLDDAAVSAQHLSVRYRDGEFVATDLDSANGTFVNGRRIEKHALAANDVLQVGTTRLVFLHVPAARAAVS
jgi:Inner membrane component of T3SS, cytoplasmic domain